MFDSAKLSRAHLVYGVCLPLAVLIGFFLSDPLQLSAIAALGLLALVLVWPLFIRWHHPILVGVLHSVFILAFLPGSLPVWIPIAFFGFLMVLARRSIDPGVRLAPPGGVAWALVAMALVVLATALARGGVGLRTLGADSMGGKKYVFVLLGIAAFFVIASRPVPRKRVGLYLALFCLSGFTGVLSNLVYIAGDRLYWLFNIIDTSSAMNQALAVWDVRGNTLFRNTAAPAAASALLSFMLARMGLREALNLRRPWPILLMLACIAVGTIGGFRSFLLGVGLFLTVLFISEGLHKTRYLPWVLAASVVGFGALAAFSDRLPLSVQRTISFLPIPIDAQVNQDAQGSWDWRTEMWDSLKGDVPKYLFLGKGYAIDPGALQLSGFNSYYGFGMSSEWAVLTGEYHNGPLSIIIPFGIWGLLAFSWFLVAAVLRMRWFCRHGDPGLEIVNRALFAMMVSKIIFFFFFFGALNSDMVEFAALAGLAECLNAEPLESAPVPDESLTSPVHGEEQFV